MGLDQKARPESRSSSQDHGTTSSTQSPGNQTKGSSEDKKGETPLEKSFVRKTHPIGMIGA
jgi:hypothetical protein